MNRKNIFCYIWFFVFNFVFIITINSEGQKNIEYNENKSYLIWSIMNVHYKNEQGFQAERSQLAIHQDFIKQLSPEIKIIIAFYSKYLSFSPGIELLADALGSFQSLKEAQEILLKDKDGYFTKIEKKLKDCEIQYLNMTYSKDIVSFEYNACKIGSAKKEIDKYIIGKGNIKIIN